MRPFFLLCCALSLPLFAAERVVTPNWAMASTLTAMGFPPLAMGDKRIYPLWMSDPVQPPSVVDLGERYRPNRELLAQLPLSLVFDNFFYTHLRAVYPPDVPVVDVLFDGGNEAPQQSWATYVTMPSASAPRQTLICSRWKARLPLMAARFARRRRRCGVMRWCSLPMRASCGFLRRTVCSGFPWI